MNAECREPTSHAPRLRGRWLFAVLIAVVLALTGCSSIPMSGPVGKSDSDSGTEPFENYRYNPRGPQPGAGPEDIVSGFINAGTGVQDDFKVARQFLAPDRSKSWNPDEKTLVSSEDPRITKTGDHTFAIELDLARVIDGNGISEMQAPGVTETVKITVIKVDGQWRISKVPNVLILSTADFSALFKPQTLYFYDPTFTYAVPDVRWFVDTRSAAASAVRVLLNGPAPYLKGAVVSAFPPGTMLARPSVPIDPEEGSATVDLTSSVLERTTARQRRRMLAQLEMTLVGSNTISSVRMTVDQREVKIAQGVGNGPVAIRDKRVPTRQVAVVDHELRMYRGAQVHRIKGVPSVAEFAPRDPAMTTSGKTFAFLSGDRTDLLTVRAGEPVITAYGGKALTPPSFDPWKWVWTAEGNGSGVVVAVNTASETPQQATVRAQWLKGQSVTELKVSRDGTRALVIASTGGASRVYISGIIRNADGVPTELTEPITLQPTVPVDSGAWLSDSSVVVMQASADTDVTAQILRLDGTPDELAPLHGMLNISAGNGPEEIFGQTAAGIFDRSGNSWSLQHPGVRYPSFAG